MTHHSFTFIVLEKDHFVAQDMCAGLAEAAPHSRFVHLAGSWISEEQLPDFQNDGGLPVLVAKSQIKDMDDCPTVAAWRKRGWPIVLRVGIDPLEQIRARGWYPLATPFSCDDLDDLVRRLTLGERHRRLA